MNILNHNKHSIQTFQTTNINCPPYKSNPKNKISAMNFASLSNSGFNEDFNDKEELKFVGKSLYKSKYKNYETEKFRKKIDKDFGRFKIKTTKSYHNRDSYSSLPKTSSLRKIQTKQIYKLSTMPIKANLITNSDKDTLCSIKERMILTSKSKKTTSRRKFIKKITKLDQAQTQANIKYESFKLSMNFNKNSNTFISDLNYKEKILNKKFNSELMHNKKKEFCFIKTKEVNEKNTSNIYLNTVSSINNNLKNNDRDKIKGSLIDNINVSDNIISVGDFKNLQEIENEFLFNYSLLKDNKGNEINEINENNYNNNNNNNNNRKFTFSLNEIKENCIPFSKGQINRELYDLKNPNIYINSGSTDKFTQEAKIKFWMSLFNNREASEKIGIALIKKIYIKYTEVFSYNNKTSIDDKQLSSKREISERLNKNNKNKRKSSLLKTCNYDLIPDSSNISNEKLNHTNINKELENEILNKFLADYNQRKVSNKDSDLIHIQDEFINALQRNSSNFNTIKSTDNQINNKIFSIENSNSNHNKDRNSQRNIVMNNLNTNLPLLSFNNIQIVNNNNNNNNESQINQINKSFNINSKTEISQTNTINKSNVNNRISNKEIEDLVEIDNMYKNQNYRDILLSINFSRDFNSLYGKITLILRELINKEKLPFLNYQHPDKLNIQVKLLSLLPEPILSFVKQLDEYILNTKSKGIESPNNFKIFSTTYGSNIKKPVFFNKKGYFSKNLKQASVIWPLIKKEDISQILSLENIYDSIFKK